MKPVLFTIGPIACDKVHKASWYMLHYGSATPKKSYAFSNSRHVSNLNAGKLRNWAATKKALKEKGQHSDLVVKYEDRNGKKRWKGSKQLRRSEFDPYLSKTLIDHPQSKK